MGRSARVLHDTARRASAAIVVGLLLVAAGCTTVLVRSPVPEDYVRDLGDAKPYGIAGENLRFWGDALSRREIESVISWRRDTFGRGGGSGLDGPREAAWLTLSGGGPDGAFGAGLLAGWAERGDRPDFRVVTGVSTGAIVALFAFLGPDYDPVLKEIYTSYNTGQVATRAILAGLLGGTALLDTRGYRGLIDRYVDDEVIARLAAADAEGRILLIGTTNLDAARPVIWNITAIAATAHPMAKTLIRDVVQASSAIPAAFPPGIIPVEAGGRRYDEMHVDGGATQQVMLFSPQLPVRALDEELGIRTDRTVYVIINNKLRKPYDPVRPRIVSIAGTAISSLISGSGTGDIYKIFAIATRDDIDLRVTWIPTEFEAESQELFDPVYMGSLYGLGYQMGLEGVEWLSYPPDFVPIQDEEPSRPPSAG